MLTQENTWNFPSPTPYAGPELDWYSSSQEIAHLSPLQISVIMPQTTNSFSTHFDPLIAWQEVKVRPTLHVLKGFEEISPFLYQHL